jgi:hypothetical protein
MLVEAGFVDGGQLDNRYAITSWGELSPKEVTAELRRPVPGVRPPDTVWPDRWAETDFYGTVRIELTFEKSE